MNGITVIKTTCGLCYNQEFICNSCEIDTLKANGINRGHKTSTSLANSGFYLEVIPLSEITEEYAELI